MSYLWGDNLSQDPHPDLRERLFISTITQDTERVRVGGERLLISNEAVCKLGSLSPMKIWSAVSFGLPAHSGLLRLAKGVWAEEGGCAEDWEGAPDLE